MEITRTGVCSSIFSTVITGVFVGGVTLTVIGGIGLGGVLPGLGVVASSFLLSGGILTLLAGPVLVSSIGCSALSCVGYDSRQTQSSRTSTSNKNDGSGENVFRGFLALISYYAHI